MPNISSFGLQYGNVDFAEVASSSFDLFITEGQPLPRPGYQPPLTDAQVAALIAQGRIVVGYVDVAVTDANRGYWDPAWTDSGDDLGTPTGSAPDWLKDQPHNAFGAMVKFWDPAWQAIVIAQAVDLVSRGYSGVFLDDVGIYYALGAPDVPTIRLHADEMAEFVAQIAAAVKAVNPDAFIVTNADPYLVTNVTADARGAAATAAYLAAVDAHLLENQGSAAIDYAVQNMPGETLLILESDGSPAFSPAEAWQRGILYVAPDANYNSLGTVAYPATYGNDFLNGGDGPNRISGGGGFDFISGGAGADTLIGGAVHDQLDGGTGVDTLIGGADSDTYLVDDAADVVIEGADEGSNDWIFARASYTLGAGVYVENLGPSFFLPYSTAVNLTGNELNNNIIGAGGADVLDGGGGADVLDGRGGADTMRGSTGNDRYLVDRARDTVTELKSEGTDTVESSASFNLSGQYVEVLMLTGSGNINATGNNQANTLIGNAGNNVLKGGAKADTMIGGLGDDRYLVDHARDTVTEHKNEGTDTVESSVSFNLSGQYVEVLKLTGSANINATGNNQANTLIGNAGNNVLKGGGDADTMIGGAGNDRYLVDNAGDTVTELKNEGTDTVESSVSFNLSGQYVEVLTLTGSANVNATGNNQANTLIGNAGNNVLKGGGGNDMLTGGGGSDSFKFGSALGAGNIDTITDHSVPEDQILLDDAVFTGLAVGVLSAAAFHTGAAAADASDRIIYNSATGALLFDADGVGGAAAVQFATLAVGLAMTNTEFLVIN